MNGRSFNNLYKKPILDISKIDHQDKNLIEKNIEIIINEGFNTSLVTDIQNINSDVFNTDKIYFTLNTELQENNLSIYNIKQEILSYIKANGEIRINENLIELISNLGIPINQFNKNQKQGIATFKIELTNRKLFINGRQLF